MRYEIKKNIGTYLLPTSLAVSILIASSTQDIAVPNIYIPYSPDKLLHFVVFGLLATVILRTKKLRQMRTRDLIISILVVSFYGLSDEICQSFTPGRSVELGDWTADTIGAIVAVILYARCESYRHLLEYRVKIKVQKMSAKKGQD